MKERNLSATFVGLALIAVNFYINFNEGWKYFSLEQATNRGYLLIAVEVTLRIALTVWAVGIAGSLFRDKVGWGVFTALVPTLSLIILGLMPPKKKNLVEGDALDSMLINDNGETVETSEPSEGYQNWLETNKGKSLNDYYRWLNDQKSN